jgi:hypothetical protein
VTSNCAVEGCERPVICRGWCNPHYQRWYKYGDATRPVRVHGDDEARFLTRIDKSSGCWLWTAHVSPTTGYVQFRIGGRAGKMVLAHRWAYEHFVGPIPAGLQLDHLCRIRHCVNPVHLEPVTAAENRRRQPSQVMSPRT